MQETKNGKPLFGDGFFIEEMEDGQWAIIKCPVYVGDTLETLSEEQWKKAEITNYPNEEIAREEFNKLILSIIK